MFIPQLADLQHGASASSEQVNSLLIASAAMVGLLHDLKSTAEASL